MILMNKRRHIVFIFCLNFEEHSSFPHKMTLNMTGSSQVNI